MSFNFNPAKFVIQSSLQEYFVDKDTGAPLSDGIVTFYEDSNHSVLKPVYKLSGSPGSYVYTELPNPLSLTAVGTMSDGSNNDIVIYYYPYLGDPSLNSDVVDLYYVVVTDSLGVPQFTRSAWPNTAPATVSDENNAFNYVPDGQFLLHQNFPNNGLITQATTTLSAGGWFFKRPNGTSSVDLVTFPRYGSFVSSPTSSPRYACQIQCTNANPTDTIKDLALIFPDVNKFGSPPLTPQYYTFYFEGQSNTGSSVSVQLWLTKNFGTGGSPSSQQSMLITTFTLGPSVTAQTYHTLTFGLNNTATLGTNDDDYVQLSLRFPLTTTFNVTVTNFALIFGNVSISAFPITTDSTYLYSSLFTGIQNTSPQFSSSIPAYDGSNLYLPCILTPNGIGYDTSVVSTVIASAQTTAPKGYYPCDGSSYLTSGYTSDGVPNSRLQKVLFNNTTMMPIFGTGSSYLTAYPSIANSFVIHNNSAGAVTASADGIAKPTTFTITTVASGAPTYNLSAYYIGSNSILVNYNIIGPHSDPEIQTAPITHLVVRFSAQLAPSVGVTSQHKINILSLPAAGSYFTFSTASSFSVSNDYYVWYKVNGSGSDPAPGGTGILVNITSSDSIAVVAQKTANAMNAWQTTNVVTIVGSSITAGGYFTVSATGANYYIWYTIGGVGTDPAVPGAIGIVVPILASDSAQVVANKTILAINSYSFAVPNLYGMHIRGNDPNYGTSTAVDTGYRFSPVDGNVGLGSFELDNVMNHNHNTTYPLLASLTGNLAPSAGISWIQSTTNTIIKNTNSNGTENLVKNVALNYYIHY